ncbi:MAG: hypothetical protein JJT75_00025 [Opitutales bacterium]|nr:hypothetical protein [Opitutales bacterium]MCH8539480.1 hypothetical protein [Opitutales bacterium]
MKQETPSSASELIALVEELGIEAVCRKFRRPPLSSRLLRETFAEDGTTGKVFVAHYPLSPSDLLEQLSGEAGDDPGLAAPLAANPRTPPPVLLSFIEHPLPEVRRSVAVNPNLGPREISRLLRDDNARVAASLALNPGLKIQHQAYLCRHESCSVRIALGQNSNLDPVILRALGDDPHPLVRRAVAAQSRAETNLLQLWADSDEEELQLGLLERRKLETGILESLYLSPHASVRVAADERQTAPPWAMVFRWDQGTLPEKEVLAGQRDLPAALQREVCQSESVVLRQHLAQNPGLGEDVVEYLIQNGEEQEALFLLENETLASTVAPLLAESGYPSVNALLATKSFAGEEVLQQLINVHLSPEAIVHLAARGRPFRGMRGDLARALARHEVPSLRALAASSEKLLPLTLKRLSEDRVQAVAERAKANPRFEPSRTDHEFSTYQEEPEITRLLDAIEEILSSPNVIQETTHE